MFLWISCRHQQDSTNRNPALSLLRARHSPTRWSAVLMLFNQIIVVLALLIRRQLEIPVVSSTTTMAMTMTMTMTMTMAMAMTTLPHYQHQYHVRGKLLAINRRFSFLYSSYCHCIIVRNIYTIRILYFWILLALIFLHHTHKYKKSHPTQYLSFHCLVRNGLPT